MDYKKILEDILELDEQITIIRGISDIIMDPLRSHPLGYLPEERIFKDFNKDSFWVVMGRGAEELIVEAMSEYVCDVDRDGEYEFKAILKWVPGDYDERGCPTMRDYLEVEHIEFNLIQTFQQRERQSKLDEILNKDLEDLFNF
jgi:hypothetical protein